MALSDSSSDSDSTGSSASGQKQESGRVEEEVYEDEVMEEEYEDEVVEEEYEDEVVEEEYDDEVEHADSGVEGTPENPINLEDAEVKDIEDVHQEGEMEDVELGEVRSEGGEKADANVGQRGLEDGEKFVAPKKPSKSSAWYWLVCFLVLGLLGGGGYLGYWLTEEDGKGRGIPILSAPTEAPGPTAAPTVGVATKFDNIQGACDTLGEIPHPYDQCACFGEIQVIPEDVAARYDYHLFSFIPTLYNDDWMVTNITDCSPQNQALVWLSSDNDFQFGVREREQRYALATLYSATNGPEWSENDDWLSSLTSCSWFGVECNSGSVSVISLEGNMIKGVLPPEIGIIQTLTDIYVTRNEIEGPIPESLFTIPTIQMVDLSFNRLTGPIPPTIGDAENLIHLNVENNQLSGFITKRIAGAKRLAILEIGGNRLEGKLPEELFTLYAMQKLDIRGNKFTGTISTTIGDLLSLTSLHLGPNDFTGQLPVEISELNSLETLSVLRVPLTGRLPPEIGENLLSLEDLTIVGTSIDGLIDPSFGSLSNLKTLDLSNNLFRGSLPTELGGLRRLESLFLTGNAFEGMIPSEFGNMVSLQEMRLNSNRFEGTLPAELSGMTSLESLILDDNEFVDRVDGSICALREGNLETFIVDCPDQNGPELTGVICPIPSCCSSCL